MKFLPIPDGDVAHVATFTGRPRFDYGSYRYRTWFTRPKIDTVKETLDAISGSGIAPRDTEASHFVIHQKNASWIGSSFDEFCTQLFNQQARYETVKDDYSLDTYKNESAIFIGRLRTSDYLVINADPWSNSDGIRHFEVILLLDGLPLNDDRLDPILDSTGLKFGSGESIEIPQARLSSKSVAGLELEVEECYLDKYGDVEFVQCENPLYRKDGLLGRILPKGKTILSEYKYVLAEAKYLSDNPEAVGVDHIVLSDFSKIGRHSTQDLQMVVSPV